MYGLVRFTYFTVSQIKQNSTARHNPIQIDKCIKNYKKIIPIMEAV